MNAPNERLETALDAALKRTLTAPILPQHFQQRLSAAIHRADSTDVSDPSVGFDRERDRQLADLRSGYVRIQRHTLIGLLVGAFTTGVLAQALLPTFEMHFGNLGYVLLACVGAAAGLSAGATAWLRTK
jgi:hypothetical protein